MPWLQGNCDKSHSDFKLCPTDSSVRVDAAESRLVLDVVATDQRGVASRTRRRRPKTDLRCQTKKLTSNAFLQCSHVDVNSGI